MTACLQAVIIQFKQHATECYYNVPIHCSAPVSSNAITAQQIHAFMHKTTHIFPKRITTVVLYRCCSGKLAGNFYPSHPTSIQPHELLESYEVKK